MALRSQVCTGTARGRLLLFMSCASQTLCLSVSLLLGCVGPLGHYLYQLLERLFEGHTGAAAGILRLIAVNVGIIPCQMIVYFVSTGLIMGLSKAQIIARIKAGYLPLLLITWKFFPIIQVSPVLLRVEVEVNLALFLRCTRARADTSHWRGVEVSICVMF